jgi:hypothetical protein
MKLVIIATLTAILLSSCLKQSIPDAMLAAKNSGGKAPVTATLSYEVNGNAVNISVDDADHQDRNYYTLGCSGSGGYALQALSNSGELAFVFYTDSLTTGNYNYTGIYGDMFILSFNGTDEFVHVASDSMSFNIVSNKDGHISGNFSGQLTPMITAGNPYNIYGDPGSVSITNGTFQNVPVFY